MSKITPKNLSYDSTLPPFLQRLQANNSSHDGRNEFQSARPKKPRSAEDDAEDEPVYFDEESGETLTKKEWEEKDKAGEVGEEVNDGLDGKEGEKSFGGEKKEAEKEKIAAIGVSKKRKAGKVVGAEDEDENGNVIGDIKHVAKPEAKRVEKGKSAKKGKKIKLSFGDDE
jgi:hypothetical protein